MRAGLVSPTEGGPRDAGHRLLSEQSLQSVQLSNQRLADTTCC